MSSAAPKGFLREVSSKVAIDLTVKGTVALLTLAAAAYFTGLVDAALPAAGKAIRDSLTPLGEASTPNWLVGILAVGCLGMAIALVRDRTQSVRVSVDDAHYLGAHPYADPHPLTGVIFQVAIINKTGRQIAITSIKLQLDGWEPLASVEQRTSEESGRQILVPRGGGFAAIPAKEHWWRPPNPSLGPWDASTGWIGFLFTEESKKLKFREARRLKGFIIVAPSSGRPVRARILPCTMPDLSTPQQRSLYGLDEEIEDLRARQALAEAKMTGGDHGANEKAQRDWSFWTQLLSEKEEERKRVAESMA